MKLRRSDVRRQVHVLPILKFESQSLTSYAGLVVFHQLLAVAVFDAGCAPRLVISICWQPLPTLALSSRFS